MSKVSLFWEALLIIFLFLHTHTHTQHHYPFSFKYLFSDTIWPRLRQGYPLNLSISLSGGRETNQDSPSNGEWSGNSSSLKPVFHWGHRIVAYREVIQEGQWPKCLGTGCHGGWEPRLWLLSYSFVILFQRVGLLESAALSGWYTSSKAKYWHETDSEQVPWGKDEKNFEKRVK